MQGKDIIWLHQMDTTDADDGQKIMWLRSSADKVIEADPHYVLRYFVYELWTRWQG
ncbi:MAG: hypothetical protein M1406_00900 [Nitrospirae bacterium]|nr:hypothetical protein [Nitrospirota bacterium]